jgi:hypothetical protein
VAGFAAAMSVLVVVVVVVVVLLVTHRGAVLTQRFVRWQPLTAALVARVARTAGHPVVATSVSGAVAVPPAAALAGRTLRVALDHHVDAVGDHAQLVVFLTVFHPDAQLDPAAYADQVALPQSHGALGHRPEAMDLDPIGLRRILPVDIQFDDDALAVARTERTVGDPTS